MINNMISSEVRPATMEWKENRINVISNLKSRIDYLVDLRISQIRECKLLKPISTWELDSLLEKHVSIEKFWA